MPRIVTQGKLSHKLSSYLSLYRIAFGVIFRRFLGRPLVKEWSRDSEIGVLFWREKFIRALSFDDLNEGRAYFDSLLTETDDIYETESIPSQPGEPTGHWIIPRHLKRSATMLYFHGGGYEFRSAVSYRFAEMLCHVLGIRLFMPIYRLTPENPHPAQIEDAIAAYRYVSQHVKTTEQLVVAGDSAGGHLTLMLLVELKKLDLPQPALAIGISPWTDISARGQSLITNNKYDLVQGYMAVQFGEWLKGSGDFTDEELSPIHQKYRGLAPIYLQGGGKEILIDMIRDFAATALAQGADVKLDVWQHMVHDFQAQGYALPESREALERIATAIQQRTENSNTAFNYTEVVSST